MGTISDDLDKIQEILHDSEAIWSRTELLHWLNDALRQFLAESKAIRQLYISDIPGRYAITGTYDWEDGYEKAVFWRNTHLSQSTLHACTHAWETEFLDNLTPTDSKGGITNMWEWAYLVNDRHYQFALPRNHEVIVSVAWDDFPVHPIITRELDESTTRWMEQKGRPIWWTEGIGRNRTIEIYEIITDYNQQYNLEEANNGIPRRFTGDRSYSAGSDPIANFAYTTSGDAQVLGAPGYDFVPLFAYTNLADKDFVKEPAYNFTINYTMNLPELDNTFTQPWEFDGSDGGGVARGMWPWERLDPAGGYASTVDVADARPQISEPGIRITQAAKTGEFCTQTWEKNQLDGDAIGTGDIIGCYLWELDFGAKATNLAVGLPRTIDSPDRQYMAVNSAVGAPREYKSSADSLSIWHVVMLERELSESDIPDMIPSQLQKYLRYGTLARAFHRSGEGQNDAMATHYLSRFKRGVQLFKRLADISYRDRVYARESMDQLRARPPRVRLPAEFERIW